MAFLKKKNKSSYLKYTRNRPTILNKLPKKIVCTTTNRLTSNKNAEPNF